MEKEGDSVLMSLPGLSSYFFLSQSPEKLSFSFRVEGKEESEEETHESAQPSEMKKVSCN